MRSVSATHCKRHEDKSSSPTRSAADMDLIWNNVYNPVGDMFSRSVLYLGYESRRLMCVSILWEVYCVHISSGKYMAMV